MVNQPYFEALFLCLYFAILITIMFNSVFEN